jgi:hypothetical protein
MTLTDVRPHQDKAQMLSFLSPPGFRSVAEAVGADAPAVGAQLQVALNEAGMLYAAVHGERYEGAVRAAALTICALPFMADANTLCRSLARNETAQGRQTTLATLAVGPAALSVADGISVPGDPVPWQLARYRAWIPLQDHPIVLLADLTTPRVSGWEDFGTLMAGMLISLRIHEGETA